jgi:hypothetical protein
MTQAEPETALDAAHAAMEAAPEDEALRLAFHACLAAAELFLLLEREPEGEEVAPRVYPLEAGPVVLAFDSEARLAAFTGAPAPYAALPGRRLVALLAGQGVGLGLNFEVAPSARLLPPEAIDWLAEVLREAPQTLEAAPAELGPPVLPPALIAALDARLARASGLARCAWLAAVRHRDGSAGHLLALPGVVPGAEAALAQALGEALRLAGVTDAGPVDIVFPAEGDPLEARLARVGLRFDIPAPPEPSAPRPPGLDPERPPRLR